MADVLRSICGGSDGKVSALEVVLPALVILCFVFAVVTWFKIPATHRSRITLAAAWRQRAAFASPKHFRLFIAGILAVQMGAILGIINLFLD